MFEHVQNVVIKVTRDCNLRCKYCYVADKDKYKNEVMPFEVFKKLIDKIVEDKVRSGNNNFSIVFHGGEPTLIGYDNLNLFLSYAYDMFKSNNLNVTIGIQTNTTLLTDNMLQLFKDFDVNIGISFDGVNNSNKNRTSINTDYYVNLIKKLDNLGIQYGNITVVNPQNIDYCLKNLKYFRKINLPVKFNYAEDVFNIGGCEVNGTEFFEKVAKPFIDDYINNNSHEKDFLDSNLNEIFHSYFETKLLGKTLNRKNRNKRSICNAKFCGGGCYVLEVSPDGTINSCGRYDKDGYYCKVGSIYDEDFLGFKKRLKYYDLLYEKHKEILNKKCDVCFASGICDYGCMAFHYVKYRKFGIRQDLVCNYFKPLYDYISKNESAILKSYIERHLNNNVYYISSRNEITENIINNIKRYLNKNKLSDLYEVSKDEKWKSNDGKCYQIKIIKRLKD